jgi:A/G-specific adenine glycosylase
MGTIDDSQSLPSIGRLRRRLLAWYDHHRRDLPWRAPTGQRPDPYRVWLSEIMLQQTRVEAVRPYYAAFVNRWPRIEDLAAADLDEVLVAWQGLGYYARARNLHLAARLVAGAGRFPGSEAELRRLPGVGAYTAAAIAAIAFGIRTAPVDGNVLRVLARLLALATPLPEASDAVSAYADRLVPAARPGDFAQAMMDLGATVCTPRAPACLTCPWRQDCRALAKGQPEAYPVKVQKYSRPQRYGVAFWVQRPDRSVLLRRRPLHGLLGGMMEVPSSEWRDTPWTLAEALPGAPLPADWQRLPGVVIHVFTHFRLELAVVAARAAADAKAPGGWFPIDQLSQQALPTVMKKIVRLALASNAGEESAVP